MTTQLLLLLALSPFRLCPQRRSSLEQASAFAFAFAFALCRGLAPKRLYAQVALALWEERPCHWDDHHADEQRQHHQWHTDLDVIDKLKFARAHH